MRRSGWTWMVLVAVILVSWGMMTGVAAWRSAAWKYHAGDLYGEDCIQEAVDNLDTRLDYLDTGLDYLRDSSLASATDVTNLQAVALNGAGLIVQLNAIGGADDGTNTITLTTLGTGTNGVFLVVNTGTSNHLAIAKTGTWKGAAVELGESEGMVVIGNAGSFYGVE